MRRLLPAQSSAQLQVRALRFLPGAPLIRRDPLSDGSHRGSHGSGGEPGRHSSVPGASALGPGGGGAASSRTPSEVEIKTLPCRIAKLHAPGAGCDAGVPAPASRRVAALPGRGSIWMCCSRAAVAAASPSRARLTTAELAGAARAARGGWRIHCGAVRAPAGRRADAHRRADRAVHLSGERRARAHDCRRHGLRADQGDASARARARLRARHFTSTGARGSRSICTRKRSCSIGCARIRSFRFTRGVVGGHIG